MELEWDLLFVQDHSNELGVRGDVVPIELQDHVEVPSSTGCLEREGAGAVIGGVGLVSPLFVF